MTDTITVDADTFAIAKGIDAAWRLGIEEAAKIAEQRHLDWRAMPNGECPVEDDETACADIAAAIRKLLDNPASDAVLVPRAVVETIIRRIGELREYPWLPDHACRECRPESDMLVEGLRCEFHTLEALIEARQA